ITAPTLDGDRTIFVKPGHDSINKIRIKGEGAYSLNRPRGDLYIELNVKTPQDMTAKQEELAEELKLSGL
ncbi:MAG: DnaJ C-terminal domain-containing protein, partial [Nitrospinota bacterium]